MRTISNNFWPGWRRNRCGPGFTLIEVVVGLAMLGTLLAGVTLARARFTRQRATAQRRLEAVAAVDSLLANWWQAPDTFPRHDTGSVTGEPNLVWQTRELQQSQPQTVDVQIIRLEVRDTRQDPSSDALIVLDLVLSIPSESDQQEQQQAQEQEPFDDP